MTTLLQLYSVLCKNNSKKIKGEIITDFFWQDDEDESPLCIEIKNSELIIIGWADLIQKTENGFIVYIGMDDYEIKINS